MLNVKKSKTGSTSKSVKKPKIQLKTQKLLVAKTQVRRRNLRDPVYVATKIIDRNEPLYLELSKVIFGVNKTGALELVRRTCDPELPRTVTYDSLTESQVETLESYLMRGEMNDVSPKISNNRNRSRSKEMQEALAMNDQNAILFDERLRLQLALDDTNHKASGCRIGLRKMEAKTFRKVKIHGQRNKSTGRTKAVKGFQKVVKAKREAIASKT